MKSQKNSSSARLSRRSFLRHGAAGVGAVAAAPLTGALPGWSSPAPGADEPFVVIVNLGGGNDGLNTVIPAKLQKYHDQRPYLGIQAEDGLALTGPQATDGYVLHPAMPRTAALYDRGFVGLVQRVGYPRANLSHFTSAAIWSRGIRDAADPKASSGWIARYKDLYAPEPVRVIGLGTGRRLDFLGGTSASLLVNSIAEYGLHEDSRYLANSRYRARVVSRILEEQRAAALEVGVADAIRLGYESLDRFKDAVENYQSPVPYPNSSLGRRLKEVAIAASGALGTRIYYTVTGGFDTHGQQGGPTGRHAELLGGVDAAVGALAADLEHLGLWDRAVIAIVSEFGRRNDENGSLGTDHGSGSAVLLLGGRVRGGIHGPDLTDADLAPAHLPYAVDFREIWAELIAKQLGADPAPIFSEDYRRHGVDLLP